MILTPRFREGMKAAIPVWVAFVPSGIALGIAAQAHGLRLHEILLMSAWVYAGPAQFAMLAPLAAGTPPLQIVLAAVLVNLRFLPMSMVLAPFFSGIKRRSLLFAAHFISASSFVIPYLQFQKEKEPAATPALSPETRGQSNLQFFLGVGTTNFTVWIVGTAVGYEIAQTLPKTLDEGLKFILPAYFAGLLALDIRGPVLAVICLASLVLTIPAVMWSADWGWIITAAAVASAGWSLERWMARA
jgi:predicted branched-subunit amino acid permease